MAAFAHALRIAVATKARLYILHVAAVSDERDWMSFPQLREALTRWGMLSANERPNAIASKLGVEIAKV